MDYQDIRTLKFLEELDGEKVPSQRDLAKELNISLGLVNSFIKRLVSKGYFKITNIPANRVKYILTPKGAAEKTKLTYEYIAYSLDYYKTTRKKLVRVFQELENQDIKKIAFIALLDTAIDLVAVVDEKQAGGKVWGRPVITIADLKKYDFAILFITIVGLEPDEVSGQLEDMRISCPEVRGLEL